MRRIVVALSTFSTTSVESVRHGEGKRHHFGGKTSSHPTPASQARAHKGDRHYYYDNLGTQTDERRITIVLQGDEAWVAFMALSATALAIGLPLGSVQKPTVILTLRGASFQQPHFDADRATSSSQSSWPSCRSPRREQIACGHVGRCDVQRLRQLLG